MVQRNMTDSTHARLFFALWPGPEVRRRLHAMAVQHLDACGGRAMREETLHLTLLFMGNIPRMQIENLVQATSNVTAGPFSIQLQQFSCWQHNRIAYVAPGTREKGLMVLGDEVQREVAQECIHFDAQKFVPHVTLLRNIERIMDTKTVAPVLWKVEDFVLVESKSGERGGGYEILARFKLA